MSVFRVKLKNTQQGLLDLGSGNSIQRQIYVAGPNSTNRLLSDGDVFTDCNYWKKFTASVMGEEYAFIEIVTDDGSVYSETPTENVFSIGGNLTLTTNLADTEVDFVDVHGGPARFLMIQNLDASIAITGELNGDTSVTFVVGAGETMMFNQGDLVITSIRLKGASGTPNVNYMGSVRSECNT